MISPLRGADSAALGQGIRANDAVANVAATAESGRAAGIIQFVFDGTAVCLRARERRNHMLDIIGRDVNISNALRSQQLTVGGDDRRVSLPCRQRDAGVMM